jgi:hypothetical protein
MKNHWEITSFEHNENVIYFSWILLPMNLQDGSFQFWPDPSNWNEHYGGWVENINYIKLSYFSVGNFVLRSAEHTDVKLF